MRLLVDTNIFVDYLGNRQPFAQNAELLMIAGDVGEFELWASSSQITDMLYILSNGGNKNLMPQVSAAVDGLLDFVNVYAPSKADVRAALQANWDDPKDAILHSIACKLEAQAIISRNVADFEKSLVPVCNCDEFFAMLKQEKGLSFDFVEF